MHARCRDPQVRGYVNIALQEGAKVMCGYTVDELVLPEANKDVIPRARSLVTL